MGFNGNSKIDNTLPINVVLFYILSRKYQQGGSLDEHTLKLQTIALVQTMIQIMKMESIYKYLHLLHAPFENVHGDM